MFKCQFKSIIFIITTIMLLSPGCATHKAKPYLGYEPSEEIVIDASKIQTLSFLQVKESIILGWKDLNSFKADARIILISPEINKSFKCKGVLRFQKPKKIRVIGSKFASTVFDIVSDGENYWFHLPKQKVVYTGKCDATHKTNDKTYIYPDDIGTLLDHSKLFDGRFAFMETWPTFWYIHILDKGDDEFVPYGRLKIDRTDKKLTELVLFKKDTSIKVQAFFSNHIVTRGQMFPEEIQINWPETSTILILNLNNLSINDDLNPQIFQFNKPGNADIIKIS